MPFRPLFPCVPWSYQQIKERRKTRDEKAYSLFLVLVAINDGRVAAMCEFFPSTKTNSGKRSITSVNDFTLLANYTGIICKQLKPS